MIPALNEVETIAEVVSSLLSYGDVLVVDDGSRDSTADAANLAGAMVVVNKNNLGYDGALNVGFQFAKLKKYEKMITFDADGQLPNYAMPKFINALDQNTAIVLGIRNNIPRSSEKLFAIFCKMVLGLQDPFCGMKAYNLAFCERFESFDEYKSLGTDLCLRLILAGHSFKSINITVAERKGVPRLGRRFQAELKLLRALTLGVSFIAKGFILRELKTNKIK